MTNEAYASIATEKYPCNTNSKPFLCFLPFTLNAKKLILSELINVNNLTLSLINNV